MPLTEIEGQQVGVHALIVGVSDYQFLPGDDEPPRDDRTLGMKKLRTPALSAFRFLTWLKTAAAENRLPKNLASYDVLLAPSEEELQVAGLAAYKDIPTRENFVRSVREWRKRVAKNKMNIALFYFAGHGIQRNREDSVLLLHDFADPGKTILENAAEFNEIFAGMAPSAEFTDMSLTQFYFVDTCRNVPEQIKNFEKLRTSPVFDPYLGGRDDRAAPIFFAAVSDSSAYGLRGQGSHFTLALLRALERGAEDSEDHDGREVWPVSAYTLATALTIEFAALNTDQNFVPVGYMRDSVICYLNAAPTVDMVIWVAPENRRPAADLELRQTYGKFRWHLPNPAPAHPYHPLPSPPIGVLQIMVTCNDLAEKPTFRFGPRPVTQRNRVWQVRIP
jgi:hypothetical protein